MYTKDNLLNFKYGELLKIAKILGIKGGRQKAEKLIHLILKEQERNEQKYLLQPTNIIQGDGPPNGTSNTIHSDVVSSNTSLLHSDKEELLEDMEFPENSFSHDSSAELINDVSHIKSSSLEKETKNITLSSKKSKATRGKSFQKSIKIGNAIINDANISNVAENRNNHVVDENGAEKFLLTNFNTHNLKKEEENGKLLRRSGTFKLTDEEKGNRRSLRRSGTFKLNSVPSLNLPVLLNSENCKHESDNFPMEENLSSKVLSCDVKDVLNVEYTDQSSCISESNKKAHRRSGTYVVSKCLQAPENKKKRSRDSSSASDVDDISSMPVRKRRSFIVPTMGQPSPVVMDLSCNEVQTAKDIEYIEDNNSIESPFQNINASRSRVRRSLRSHLLDSRLSVHQRISILSGAASPANKPVTHLEEENEENPKEHNVENFVTASLIQSQTPGPNFTVGKEDDQTLVSSQPNKIPRFVAYAKKIKSKMPDFNKIHEKAFSKMEPLDEYMERKLHTRTRSRPLTDAMSSVKKVIKEADIFDPTVTTAVDLKINFADIKSSNLFESKTQRKSRTSISNSPLINKRPSLSGSTRKLLKTSNEIKDMNSKSLKKSETTLSNVKENPVTKNMLVRKTDSKVQNTPQKIKFIHPTSIPRLIKENMPPVVISSPWNTVKKDPLLTPGSLIRRKSYNPKVVAEIEKPSYRPYKGAVRSIGHRDILKRMAEKNPKVKSSFEMRKEQKVFIKGVRTNKRFELQMAKRGIKI